MTVAKGRAITYGTVYISHRAHELQPLTWSFSNVRASTTFCVARLVRSLIVIKSSAECVGHKRAASSSATWDSWRCLHGPHPQFELVDSR